MTATPLTPPEEVARLLTEADRARKWRLILGRAAETPLGGRACAPGGVLDDLDRALDLVYEGEGSESESTLPGRGADLSRSAPRLSRWLGDIRKYFPRDVVAVLQQDAIERKGLKQLLFEPETLGQIVPSVELAATLLSYKNLIPDRTKETAREVVRAVAEEIIRRLRSGLERSVRGALDRSRHAPLPRLANLDVRRTIRHNLRNWDRERKAIAVERTFFHARRHRQVEWTVIVCLDQSGSMATSLVYGAVTASILASLRALRTHLVAFDTEVVDFTEQCHDPVEVLFGMQLGGGTDINRAVGYCRELVTDPRKTLFLLITDLMEGGDAPSLVGRLESMVASGVKAVCMLALSDDGQVAFDHDMARRVRNIGVPAFACTPSRIPDLLEAALRGADLTHFAT